MNTIAIGSDHAGVAYKSEIIRQLSAKYTFRDFGTNTTDSVDYPDYVHPLAEAVAQGEAHFGILICGSGIGVSITANKHKGIRAALCWKAEVASLSRQHNNANIVCIPARFVDLDEAIGIIEAFLSATFEGGRHQNRVSKIENC
jgi:ribose 5-phosphate isomerase B